MTRHPTLNEVEDGLFYQNRGSLLILLLSQRNLCVSVSRLVSTETC